MLTQPRLIEDIIGQNYPKESLGSSVNAVMLELKAIYPNISDLLREINWENKDLKEKLDFINTFLRYYNIVFKLSPLLDLATEAHGLLEKFPILIYVLSTDFMSIAGLQRYLLHGLNIGIMGLSELLEKDASSIQRILIDKSGYNALKDNMFGSDKEMAKGIESGWFDLGKNTISILQSGRLSSVLKSLSQINLSENEFNILPELWKKGYILTQKRDYSDDDIKQLEEGLGMIMCLYAMIIQKLSSDKNFLNL